MTFLQSLIVVVFFVPVLAIVCMAVAEARREPDRERPMIFDTATYGDGGGDGGGS